MKKIFSFLLVLLLVAVAVLYYFYFYTSPGAIKEATWTQPPNNPPTTQRGVSIDVPEGWRGPGPGDVREDPPQ